MWFAPAPPTLSVVDLCAYAGGLLCLTSDGRATLWEFPAARAEMSVQAYRASATPGCRTSPRHRCDGCLTLSHAGQFEVDLNECLDGKVKRLWRTLQPRTEKDEVSGDVELVLQWRYNARLDYCPFDGFVDEHEG